VYLSKINTLGSEQVEVPDVKSLQSRHEFLMDTIKEKESEATRTENSLSKSEGGDRNRGIGAPYARTMKWKKSEKSTIQHSDPVPVSEYNSRPLRVPKPPQSANQKSNIAQTYEWLMRKHESSLTNSHEKNFK
jgi:hypothetical protein